MFVQGVKLRIPRSEIRFCLSKAHTLLHACKLELWRPTESVVSMDDAQEIMLAMHDSEISLWQLGDSVKGDAIKGFYLKKSDGTYVIALQAKHRPEDL